MGENNLLFKSMNNLDRNLQKNILGIAESPALLVVDMINGFTDPDCPLGSYCPTVVEANVLLLNAFRNKRLPIFFTTVVYSDAKQATVFRKKIPALDVLDKDSHWVQVDAAMNKRDNEVLIEKQWASAFFKTDLDKRLKSLSVDSIVVSGLTTSGCVRASAVDGLQNNFQVVIAEEAVGDRNQEAHRANLFDLNAKYADVLGVDTIIQSLQA